MTEFQDKQLECKECGKAFIWTADEQRFFAQKGFKNVPARCLDCRGKARKLREESQAAFEVTCAGCGKKGDAPFEPLGNKVYCEECFNKLREKEGSENKTEPA
jgi:CxxC-x17-CxxC domain-containing protein